jgi:hypothetical protein
VWSFDNLTDMTPDHNQNLKPTSDYQIYIYVLCTCVALLSQTTKNLQSLMCSKYKITPQCMRVSSPCIHLPASEYRYPTQLFFYVPLSTHQVQTPTSIHFYCASPLPSPDLSLPATCITALQNRRFPPQNKPHPTSASPSPSNATYYTAQAPS